MRKGSKHSPETVEKMRLAKLGKPGNFKKGTKRGPMPEEQRRQISATMTGMAKTPEHNANVSKALMGKPSPMRGIKRPPFSDEWRENISKGLTGKYRGEEHWNYKGNYSENYVQRRRFRTTYQPKVFKRDDYTCQICFVRGGNLQVDHIKSWSKHPKLRFELDNCRTLCMACHYYVTFKRKMPKGIIWGHSLGRRIV